MRILLLSPVFLASYIYDLKSSNGRDRREIEIEIEIEMDAELARAWRLGLGAWGLSGAWGMGYGAPLPPHVHLPLSARASDV